MISESQAKALGVADNHSKGYVEVSLTSAPIISAMCPRYFELVSMELDHWLFRITPAGRAALKEWQDAQK